MTKRLDRPRAGPAGGRLLASLVAAPRRLLIVALYRHVRTYKRPRD
jgi:hypothetical protein